jgi:hypothetical protein
MPDTYRRVVLARRPSGMPVEEDFRLEEHPLQEPGPGEILIRNHYLSIDPFQRGRMNEKARYGPSVGIGEVMIGSVVGQIVKSRNTQYEEGEFVEGLLGWQEYAIADGHGRRAYYGKGLTRIPMDRAPLSTALGVCGTPGETAYFALLDMGRPKPGETVVVTAAAGAVGSLAGQIAKLSGCRVVGVAGSDEKVRYVVDELGFDACINYKTTPDLLQTLRETCPDRIDIYFDNVGGDIADTMFKRLAINSRVVIVGRVAQYNDQKQRIAPDYSGMIMTQRTTIRGFIVFDYEDRAEEPRERIGRWVGEGKIKYRETIVEGIQNGPRALIGVLTGQNIGKQLVRLFPGA